MGIRVCCVFLFLSLLSPHGETAEIIDALADLSLGANLLEDLAGSVASVADVPSLSTLGDALAELAGMSAAQQQLTPEQRQHADLAEAFFLSPFGFSLDEMRALPRFASAIMRSDGDSAGSRYTISSSSSGSSSSSSSSSSNAGRHPFSLRGAYGMDSLEFERLAEAIAEGVANSTVTFGFRNRNPLAAAAAAAAAAAGFPLQNEEAAGDTRSQMKDLEQQAEETLKSREKETVEQEAEAEVPREEAAAEETAELNAQGAAETETAAEAAAETPEAEETAKTAEAAAEKAAETAAEAAAETPEAAAAETPEAAAAETPEAAAAETPESAAGKEEAAAETAGKTGDSEDDGEEDGKSPQRFAFWSRANPFGVFQPTTDMWYLLHWSFMNPLAILEWKAYAFNECMELLNDKDLCLKALKVEANAVNHGGTNDPFLPSTSP